MRVRPKGEVVTVKNLVGRAVAISTAACLMTAAPVAAQDAEQNNDSTTASSKTASPATMPDGGTGDGAESTDEPTDDSKTTSEPTTSEEPSGTTTPEPTTSEPTTSEPTTSQPTTGTSEPVEETTTEEPAEDNADSDEPGEGAIQARYEGMSEEQRAAVGEPTGEEVVVSETLRYRDHEHARFYWSEQHGVKYVKGGILHKYLARGAHDALGVPATDETATGDGAYFSDFTSGDGEVQVTHAIYWTAENGAHVIEAPILQNWRTELRDGNFLGYPTTDSLLTRNRDGLFNHFVAPNGVKTSFYHNLRHGSTHWVRGAIRAKWLATGGERGPLGYPVSSEHISPGGGAFVEFQHNGSSRAFVMWSPDTGAHYLKGAIADRYVRASGPWGALGYPTTDEEGTPDGRGAYNHFNGNGGSSIYWSPSTGAHDVRGGIRDRWQSLRWENSYLGYPTSDSHPIENGRRNDFQGGYIEWNSETNEITDRPW